MGFDFLTFSNPSRQLPSPLAEAKGLGGDLRQGCGLAGGKVRIPKNLGALCRLGWEPDCVVLGREKRGAQDLGEIPVGISSGGGRFPRPSSFWVGARENAKRCL